ncbi:MULTISPECIES: hypothetical protein [unclassified Okeania]|nr:MULTISPECIES: hypothetical protein [unclassified Okeania]NET14661.1 hypothetical protein [Okeania sp. SIO1H6]NES75091.1 hypothetical protein [Okeania sp. SIO1H4]NES92909.1 hypothetical protein [Okeania sp. SIO2B9]NET23432.1 hypothetical protein [Okeania sp. SIO1H5]NET75581.1 hypothetical protein [Okeania sp. SIO1F9]
MALIAVLRSEFIFLVQETSPLKKETGDRRQETGEKLHGDSLPQVILNTV